MIFQQTPLAGLYILQLERLSDERGYFARAWCEKEIERNGLNPRCVQVNVGFSPKAGTLRGLHYQIAPKAEVKIVRCTRGAMLDVAVDLRPDSPTLGHWFGVELTPDNGKMMYIPEGFAHGYQTLTSDTEMSYQTSEFFSAEHAQAIRFDDTQFGIEWPLAITCISEKDRVCPDWIATAIACST